MLIDDELFDQRMYKRTLERADATDEILSFTYAEDALRYLLNPTNAPVDLILLDVKMPRMSGFEFLNILQDETSGHVDAVIFLMLTTALTQADGLRAANSPIIKECVSKPFKEGHIQLAAHHVAARRLSRNLVPHQPLFGRTALRQAGSSRSA